MQGMPQKCRMPLYEYGSKGVLAFYQAQLGPVVTYRDLQTDVFQSFKEVGNTVIFCLQLEKALVRMKWSVNIQVMQLYSLICLSALYAQYHRPQHPTNVGLRKEVGGAMGVA